MNHTIDTISVATHDPYMCGQISLSKMCNIRHTFCFQDCFSHDRLTDEVLYQRLKPFYERTERLRILGGEPTVIPGSKDYIRWLSSSYPKMQIELVTNCVSLDEDWLEILKAHQISIQASINGVSSEVFQKMMARGSPEILKNKIFQNLETLIPIHHKSQKGIINCMSMVLYSDTAQDLDAFVLYGLKHGLNVALQVAANIGCKDIDEERRQMAQRALQLSYFCEGIIDVDVRLIPQQFRDESEAQKSKWISEKRAFLAGVRQTGGYVPAKNPIKTFIYDASPGHCQMPTKGYSLMSSGDLLPCCHMMNYPVGNVYLDDINELIDGGRRRKLQQLINKGDYRYCWKRCSYNRNPESSDESAVDLYEQPYFKLFEKGAFQDLLELLDRIKSTPLYTPDLCLLHAKCYHKIGCLNEALSYYETAIRRKVHNTHEVLMECAKLLIELRRPRQAIARLKTLIDGEPQNAKARKMIQHCLTELE
jgi:sulfatase maturation enzyme AslB (radical SAM superfamily)